MPTSFDIGVVAVGSLIGWILYTAWPARVVFTSEWLIKKEKWKTEKFPLSELSQIKFHYHAVVGFVATWEFISKSGQSILVDAHGIDNKLLSRLERHVPNFSSKEFHEHFADGDVEDTLEVWKAP